MTTSLVVLCAIALITMVLMVLRLLDNMADVPEVARRAVRSSIRASALITGILALVAHVLWQLLTVPPPGTLLTSTETPWWWRCDDGYCLTPDRGDYWTLWIASTVGGGMIAILVAWLRSECIAAQTYLQHDPAADLVDVRDAVLGLADLDLKLRLREIADFVRQKDTVERVYVAPLRWHDEHLEILLSPELKVVSHVLDGGHPRDEDRQAARAAEWLALSEALQMARTGAIDDPHTKAALRVIQNGYGGA